MDTVQAVRPTLNSYLNKKTSDDSEVIAALQELEQVDMDVDILSATQIGKIVSSLAKDKNSAEVSKLAKDLQKRWKDCVMKKPATPSPVATPKTEKRKRDEEPSTPTPQKRKLSTGEAKVEPKFQSDSSKKGVHTTDFKGSTSVPARNNVQVKLWQALGTCTIQGAQDSSTVAVAIETALFDLYKDTKNKDYLQKFRSLFTNLKDELNIGLRNALFTGDLPVERLISMSYEELANPELQQQRKNLSKYQTEARRGDRHLQEATCSMFTCHKCHQNKTTYYQLQTRSADEPMTTFVTCCNCGNHWRF